MLTISRLMVNGLTEPVGIRDSIELSWALESDQRNMIQTGYQIQLLEEKTLLYDSSSVPSRQSAHVPLAWDWKSITRYTLRVRAAAGDERSGWAETSFVTAFQTPEEWRGSFRSAEPEEDRDQSYGTLLRRTFPVSKPVKEAWLVCSAHGIYHAFLNGRAVSPDELAPGWTSYHKHLRYQTYEVTSLLRPGENALGVMLGAGWYKGMMGYKHTRNNYGTRTAFGGQLILRYADGTEEWVFTDESWKGSRGPVLFSEIYDGEVYDARLQGGAQPRREKRSFGSAPRGQKCRLTAEQPGWAEPGFDDSGWRATEPVPRPVETLVPQQGCPVREMECVSPVRLFITPAGEQVIDFGQNMAGWCAFTVENAAPGDVAELLFFETLDAEGNVYTENLRGIRPRVRYICKGEAREQFRPLFTFQGFQYAQIVSWPGTPKIEQFQGRVVYSAMEETASFHCSDPRLNQLWHNILWGMKGNFIDLPTDCPQRDERLGWTGDVVAFAPTSCLLMNTDAFYRKWLADVRADQFANGAVPHVVPDLLTGHMEGDWLLDQDIQGGASGWGDVTVLLPWALYLAYGDKTVLAEQMDSILRWLNFLDRHSEGCLFRFGAQFGDWLALDAAPGSYKGATPDEYCSAAYYCHVTRLVGKMLRVLGRETEAEALERKARTLTADFQRRFFTSEGRLTVPTQTAHVLALRFDLVPETWKTQVAQGLKDLLAQSGGHLTTGFLGTPHIAPALSENGCLEEAYALLLKEDCPGWLYQVKAGASTVWEHWDGKKPDGTMWSADMNSFNHYAYGSIGEWMFRTIGGLELDEERPGYEHFFIRPQIGGGLEFAEIAYQSSYGKIAVKWRKNGDAVTLDVTIPANTSAEIQLVQAREVLDDGGLTFAENQSHAGSGRWRVQYRI